MYVRAKHYIEINIYQRRFVGNTTGFFQCAKSLVLFYSISYKFPKLRSRNFGFHLAEW